jgi:hypothetical protein
LSPLQVPAVILFTQHVRETLGIPVLAARGLGPVTVHTTGIPEMQRRSLANRGGVVWLMIGWLLV